MLGHNFCRPNGRLVKLLLFSTVLDKSLQTSNHFTTFEKKSQVSPTNTTKLFGFWYNIYEQFQSNLHFAQKTPINWPAN